MFFKYLQIFSVIEIKLMTYVGMEYFVTGITLLRAKDHFGGIRRHPGQKQPPRIGAEHIVHPIEDPFHFHK